MSTNSDELVRDLLFATLKEARARRRWGIFFRSLFFIALFLIIYLIMMPDHDGIPTHGKSVSHTALVDVDGVIDSSSDANADDIVTGLDDAFKDPNTKGVILRIDSPGGSPVQASYVYNEVMRLRNVHPNLKVYAVCTDMCTSAAYYMASATDAIYANQSSLVGSIGVLIDGFGFVGSMDKLGIDRRLITSGQHKGFLDPFSPLNQDDEKFAQTMLNQVHQQFISDVTKGRGNRLKINTDTFSGLAWTGQQALGLGIIDGFASAGQVARDVIKADTIIDYTQKPSFFDRFAQKMGASFGARIGEMLGSQDDKVRAQI
jgi:protease IV